jgi:hypothetical protein
MVDLSKRNAWPNLAQAATMLGLNRSTLSRLAKSGQIDSRPCGLGRGSRIVPPREVLRLSTHYAIVDPDVVIRQLAHFVADHLEVSETEALAELYNLMPTEDELPTVEQQSREIEAWLTQMLERQPVLQAAPLDLSTDWSQVTYGALPQGQYVVVEPEEESVATDPGMPVAGVEASLAIR